MARWHIKRGSWWMLQWSWGWWFSLGLHLDLRWRGRPYGPYMDIHLGHFSLSVGRYPAYTDEEELVLTHSRGGQRWPL